MKVVVLYGQIHEGSSYHITHLLLQTLEVSQLSEFFLPGDASHFCKGCYTCFLKGEHLCPHAMSIQPIAKHLEEADLIILASPCYVYGMTGQLKAFLDHLAYRWMSHRPHPAMFFKVGVVISSAAGAGARAVTKDLKRHLSFWGLSKIYAYPQLVQAMNWEEVSDKQKKSIQQEIEKLGKRISRQLQKKYQISLKTKLLFSLMRLSQRFNDWNETDRNHWESEGWLLKKRPW